MRKERPGREPRSSSACRERAGEAGPPEETKKAVKQKGDLSQARDAFQKRRNNQLHQNLAVGD